MRPLARCLLPSILMMTGAAPALGAQLFWLDSSFQSPRLTRANIDGAFPVSIDLPPQSLPQSLALDPASRTLYWTELTIHDAHVRRASSDLSTYSPQGQEPTPWSCLRGIAVDSDNQKLYVTATNLQIGSRIERMNPDGSERESLQIFGSGSASEPRDLALDLAVGRMYWCDFGTNTIQSASLNQGSSRTDVITGLHGPSGLALDLVNDRIYWTETNNGTIGHASLDGTGATTLIADLAAPLAITLDAEGKRIYWTEIGTPRIRSARLDGTDVRTISIPGEVPTGIWVVGTSPADAPLSSLFLEFALEHPAPNPATTATTLAFTIPEAGSVRVGVFDVQGREVVRLADRRFEAGRHFVEWDGGDGHRSANGIYFVRCDWNGKAAAQRVTWIR